MNMRLLMVFNLCIFVATSLTLRAQQTDWITHYEQSGFAETPRYEQTIEYCRKLANHSPIVHYVSFGTSPQGRELPLLVVDKDRNFEPGKTNKTVILLQAAIHPGEPDGKDAVLTLIRDMIIDGNHQKLLDDLTILFIPIFNVDGHERFGPYNRINQNGPKEMGWRTTAQNLNLNRDFIKADAPEMQHWLVLFDQWNPHFFIDCHTTNGADYQYALTYMLESYGNMDEGLTRWQLEVYEPKILERMKKSGFPIFPYVQFRQWHDPRSGLRIGVAPGMLSQGYSALRNCPGLLIETHMLKDYKTRVDATYAMILNTMQILADENKTLQNLILEADNYAASPEFRKEEFPLGFSISGTDSVMVEFLGVEYETEVSTLTGGSWFRYYADRPVTFTLPLFNHNVPTAKVKLPEAYIVPAEWDEVIRRIALHGVEMIIISKPIKLEIETYRFENPVWRNTPNEGRHTVSTDHKPFITEKVYPTGSAIIFMNQANARLIARMLEPGSSDSFLQWGFFNAIFEQKEYAETYVMEPLALEMLESDAQIRQEFEELKQNSPELLKNQWALVNWFYSKTPYWDQKKNIYPVGRIFDIQQLNN